MSGESPAAVSLRPRLSVSHGGALGGCVRDGFVVDIDWRGGALHETRLSSRLGRTTTVRLGDRTRRLDTERGETYVLTARGF